jgi:hypothetical protein
MNLGFKRKLNLLKNYVVRGNFEMFPLLLGLDSKEGNQQVSSLISEELRNKIKYDFLPFQHKCMTLTHLLRLRT